MDILWDILEMKLEEWMLTMKKAQYAGISSSSISGRKTNFIWLYLVLAILENTQLSLFAK
jgi:hypothetical protein